ncbi:MAG TPA: hypothetical protein VFY17_08330, partial [Pilimelia sp.]|nr:hypothetical protein [Pilimelia sp.]
AAVRAGAGAVTVTATDAATGRDLRGLCAQALLPDPSAAPRRCTKGAAVTLDAVPAGDVTVAVWTRPHRYYVGAAVLAAVPPAGRVAVAVALGRGGVITTAVTAGDAPVADTSVEAFNTAGPRTHQTWAVSRDNGAAATPPLPPGTYRLFAVPPAGTDLGRQWVGPLGGTGREHLAATVTVHAGQRVAGPRVRLDPAGAVRGTITTPAGADVPAWVHLRTERGWDAADGVAADDRGAFTLDGLGPYEWALRFAGTGFAHQWAGGAADSAAATGVPVRAGGTTEVALRAVPGARVRGALRPAGPGENLRYVEVLDAATGARLGMTNQDADITDYAVMALGGGSVKLRWTEVLGNGPRTTDGWYDRAATFADATAVRLPRGGGTTVDITVGGGPAASATPPAGAAPAGTARRR